VIYSFILEFEMLTTQVMAKNFKQTSFNQNKDMKTVYNIGHPTMRAEIAIKVGEQAFVQEHTPLGQTYTYEGEKALNWVNEHIERLESVLDSFKYARKLLQDTQK
jgi:Zn/Cd-binding protein ZinT